MVFEDRGRRQFLKESIGLAGLAEGGGRLAKGRAEPRNPAAAVPEKVRWPAPDSSHHFSPEGPPYGGPSHFEHFLHFTSTDAPQGTLTPQEFLCGILTPSALDFAINHGSPG